MIKERKTTRLQGYDYSSDNLYFVTSCVHNRGCCFGDIVGTGRDPSLHHGEYVSVGTGRDLSLPPLSTRKGEHRVKSAISQMILNEYGLIAEQQWHWLGEQYPYVVLHEFVVMPNHIHGIIEISHSRNKSPDPIKIKPLSELIGAYKTTVSKQIHLSGYMEFKWQRSLQEIKPV